MAIGFGNEEKEIKFSDYRGNWALISSGNGTFSGKIVKIDYDNISIFPYLMMSPSEEYKIRREGLPMMIKREGVNWIRQTSEEETLEFCAYSNRQKRIEKFMKERSLQRELSNPTREPSFENGSGI